MPELPEVETVRRILAKKVLGETIAAVSVYYEPMIRDGVDRFLTIRGQRIEGFERIGKHLIFRLSKSVMIVHLRMEGKFYIKRDEPKEKHEHVILRFQSGRTLRFHDVRKFGTFTLRTKHDYLLLPPLSLLGPEPKDADPKEIHGLLKRKHVAIKTALLDQHVIAGLGNIYVDETLFRSGIHPTRRTDSLSETEVERIIIEARAVLAQAVSLGGSSIRSYTATLGVTGRFQTELMVHMREGESCPICRRPIIKMKVGGRGTYVCPYCQT
ncbi:MAG: bifunctional DNA-formamidopyrimidine glycosylase/DNA-(apurinic or apyrimidinic site) lyase [Acholeplasmataceae bacterium]